MAQPTTARGSKVLIQLGNGAGPEVFTAPCALDTKGLNLTADTNDFNVPDCDTPDDPTWTTRVVSALSGGVTGSGVLALESLDTWRDWFLSGLAKNIRVKIDVVLASNGGYFAMSAVLTTFNIGADQNGLITVEVGISSNGEVTWTDAAA